ncbi:hypothetical protein [Streptomyces sp. AS02]|uniref:hypothetical protein n=1 Tax=Streptomyces sp. AS02 TaxID=2938946 RepID=UPI00201FEA1D|nr:hypothetical protein [Streptomyces sp. AS02]MCL8017496.1 hypothetical protein [Streptomyces sp. AS02]
MSADEARDKSFAAPARERTGPRHAAPKKPLFTRLHMPAGKAIAMAAMPTAVLMGMGFTPTLALADDGAPTTSNSLTADEYKECVAALAEDADGSSASPTPDADESTDSADENEAKPTPSASPSENSSDSSGSSGSSGDSSSSDSGSDDAAEPTPTPSPSKSSEAQSGDTATASPSPSESGGNLLEDIGDAISGIFTGGNQESASPSPTPSASASATEGATDDSASEDSGKDTSDPVKETAEKVTDTVEDTVKDTTDTASKAAEDATEAAEEAAEEATATPSPSASATELPEDCEAATEDEGGVDNKILVPDDPWYLEASSLTLKGADYQGVVEVKTASGKTKKVLKYVISDGTDIGDLHQLVKDKQSGKTHHVQAAKGSKSTITDGKTVMYTESISGNLLGLIPVTFDPEHPPPLNIPYIYFTKVKVTQAGQFGGTLTVPGLHQYVTD